MGIAVTDGERTLGEIITNMKKNHSIRLMPAIDQLMKEVGISTKELEKIVVAAGPGSYTGVRIGVTTAKTLAWSLDIPIIGVSSLAVMAQVGRYFEGYVSPIMDARREQVYTGLYSGGQLFPEQWASDRIILLENWLTQLSKLERRILFIGQDVEIHGKMIRETLGEQAEIASPAAHLPRPSELAYLGQLQQPSLSPHHFIPNYHQLAEAEAKWRMSQKEKGQKND